MAYDEVLDGASTRSWGSRSTSSCSTATKMFCGCPTEFGAEPNSQVCPVCLGLPGALPVVNEKAVESAIRIGLALNCEIAQWCRFARKNYFYPDMPKNFQTSQYDEPIAFDGLPRRRARRRHDLPRRDRARAHGGGHRQVAARRRLDRSHPRRRPLARRLQPRRHPAHRDRHQAACVGAGERAPEVARAYVSALRDLLKALDVSDVKMEQGSMRCDVNVSPRHERQGAAAVPLGHPHRDQERQLAALGRAGGPLRDVPPRGDPRTAAARSSRRPATGTRTPASRPRAA